MIKHYGDFYGVGQGLFVCGDVRVDSQHINYFYDCGGETSKSLIRDSVNKAILETKNRRLDILFLSHLHLDHTSGVDFLLKGLQSKGGVGKVILPYFYPAERVALAGSLADSEGYPPDSTGWYMKFLRAPAAYLKENGAKEIYFVRGGDGPDTPPFGNPVISELSKSSHDWQHKDGEDIGRIPLEMHSYLDDKKTSDCIAAESSVDGDNLTAPASIVSSRSTLLSPWWFFLLFNKDISPLKFSKFKEEFEDIRCNKSMEEILVDKTICREVKHAYERIFGVKRLNDTSLAVLSACRPTQMIRPFNFQFGPYTPSRMPSLVRFSIPRFPSLGRNLNSSSIYPFSWVGFVLLGDLPANREWILLSKKFGLALKGYNNHVLSYQIAHHGSKENWSSDQTQLSGRPTYVISAGINNRHNHPDAEVLRDIALSNNPLIWVNEDWSFSHSLTIG